MKGTVQRFGPLRGIGYRYEGPISSGEVPALWERLFVRFGELETPQPPASFGPSWLITNDPEMTIGYLAMVEVLPDAPVPDGMEEYRVEAGEFYVHPIENFSELTQAWTDAFDQAQTLPGYRLDAEHRLPFEYYPSDFTHGGPFWLYLPVAAHSGHSESA